MKERSKDSDEIEMGPSFQGLTPFRLWRNGKVVESGLGQRGSVPGLGETCVQFGPKKDNGRYDIQREFTINSKGSVCHSGANSQEYLDGWDRIFAAGKASSRPN